MAKRHIDQTAWGLAAILVVMLAGVRLMFVCL